MSWFCRKKPKIKNPPTVAGKSSSPYTEKLHKELKQSVRDTKTTKQSRDGASS